MDKNLSNFLDSLILPKKGTRKRKRKKYIYFYAIERRQKQIEDILLKKNLSEITKRISIYGTIYKYPINETYLIYGVYNNKNDLVNNELFNINFDGIIAHLCIVYGNNNYRLINHVIKNYKFSDKEKECLLNELLKRKIGIKTIEYLLLNKFSFPNLEQYYLRLPYIKLKKLFNNNIPRNIILKRINSRVKLAEYLENKDKCTKCNPIKNLKWQNNYQLLSLYSNQLDKKDKALILKNLKLHFNIKKLYDFIVLFNKVPNINNNLKNAYLPSSYRYNNYFKKINNDLVIFKKVFNIIDHKKNEELKTLLIILITIVDYEYGKNYFKENNIIKYFDKASFKMLLINLVFPEKNIEKIEDKLEFCISLCKITKDDLSNLSYMIFDNGKLKILELMYKKYHIVYHPNLINDYWRGKKILKFLEQKDLEYPIDQSIFNKINSLKRIPYKTIINYINKYPHFIDNKIISKLIITLKKPDFKKLVKNKTKLLLVFPTNYDPMYRFYRYRRSRRRSYIKRAKSISPILKENLNYLEQSNISTSFSKAFINYCVDYYSFGTYSVIFNNNSIKDLNFNNIFYNLDHKDTKSLLEFMKRDGIKLKDKIKDIVELSPKSYNLFIKELINKEDYEINENNFIKIFKKYGKGNINALKLFIKKGFKITKRVAILILKYNLTTLIKNKDIICKIKKFVNLKTVHEIIRFCNNYHYNIKTIINIYNLKITPYTLELIINNWNPNAHYYFPSLLKTILINFVKETGYITENTKNGLLNLQHFHDTKILYNKLINYPVKEYSRKSEEEISNVKPQYIDQD